MGKKKDKAKKLKAAVPLEADGKGKKAQKVRMPKSKCCVSKPQCKRCPIRMLKEGTLPEGYTVKKRKLVKVDKTPDKKLAKAA